MKLKILLTAFWSLTMGTLVMAAPQQPNPKTLTKKSDAEKTADVKAAQQDARDAAEVTQLFDKEFRALLIGKEKTLEQSTQIARREVLDSAKAKIPPTPNNIPREDPAYPPGMLFEYLRYEYGEYLEDEPQDLFLLVFQDLTYSEQLLAAATPDDRRRGLWMADFVSGSLASILEERKTPDPKLIGRIYDGWIMPNLVHGRSGAGTELGRLGILRKAFHVYQEAGEKEKSYAVLRMAIALAEYSGSINQADQSRIRLATALAAGKRYQEAIEYLQGLKELVEAKQMIPKYQQKLDAQQKEVKPVQK